MRVRGDGALFARQLALQDIARPRERAAKGARCYRDTEQRRQDEPLALQRRKAQLVEDAVGDRRRRRDQDGVVPQLQDGPS
jgi:hypothetical protein